MSRFSLAEAKGLGWSITHENPKGIEGKPRWIEASKTLIAPGFPFKITTEGAETMGLLLERVFKYEAHLDSIGYTEAAKAAREARDAADAASADSPG